MSFQVGLMGASLHTANRGVSALGSSLAALIWRARPEARISVLIGNSDARPAQVRVGGERRTVDTVNYRLSPRAALHQQLWWILALSVLYRLAPFSSWRRWCCRRSPWVRFVADADFVGDIRGGDSFSDIYGVGDFLLSTLPVLSVLWIRGGIHLLPQTCGPFRSRLSERLAGAVLMRADSIWCRDRASVQEVSRLTRGRRSGRLCPDVAFALEAVRPQPPVAVPPLPDLQGLTLVGINVSGLVYHGGFTRANMFGLKLDYRAFLTRFIEQVLSEASNRVLLVPHTYGAAGRVESDPDACQDVYRRMAPSLRDRMHIVTEEYDQHEIKGVIGLCDFFVGSRMHACIAALSQGIPTLGVAYSRKFSGVFETVGAEEWVVDGRTASVDEALARAGRLFADRRRCRADLQARVARAQLTVADAFTVITRPRGPEAGRTPAADSVRRETGSR